MKRDFLRCLAGAAAGVLLTGTSAFAADLGVAPPAASARLYLDRLRTWRAGRRRSGPDLGQCRRRRGAVPIVVRLPTAMELGGFRRHSRRLQLPVGGAYRRWGAARIQFRRHYWKRLAPPLNYPSTSIREFGSADARLGLAFDRLLIYAIGGFAYADIRSQIQLAGLAPGVIDFFAVNRYGFDVGGGLEYNFYGNWTARAEYRYYDWGTRGFNSAGFVSTR